MASIQSNPRFRATRPVTVQGVQLDAPAAGFKLWTYAAGSTTPKATYADIGTTTPLPNPITLDANGEALIYLGLGSYKFLLKTPTGTTVTGWPVDNIKSIDQLVKEASDILFASLYTIVQGDGIHDNTAAVAAAVALGKPIFFFGVSSVSSPVSITVPIVDTIAQIFTPGSAVTIDNGLPVRPEWWGDGEGTVDIALRALPQPGGGIVQLRAATYKRQNYAYSDGPIGTGHCMDRDNITIQGVKMPMLSLDCKKLIGGSIIRGLFLAYANNVEMRDLGIDCGNTYTQTINGGVVSDAFVASYPNGGSKTANTLKNEVRLHNVIGLCNAPGDQVHAVLASEGYARSRCTGEIVGCYGVHGIVFKCEETVAETLTAYLNNSEGVILKSDDQTTAALKRFQCGIINSHANGPLGWTPYTLGVNTSNIGVELNPNGADIDNVQIGLIMESGHARGVGLYFGDGTNAAHTVSRLMIGDISTEDNAINGLALIMGVDGVGAKQKLERCSFGAVTVKGNTAGTTSAIVIANADSSGAPPVVHVASLHTSGCGVGIQATANGRIVVDAYESVDTQYPYYITDSGKIFVGKLTQSGTSTGIYFNGGDGSGQVPALDSHWANFSSDNSTFSVYLEGKKVNMKGLVVPGTGATSTVLTLPVSFRPKQNLRFYPGAKAGSGTPAPTEMVIGIDGTVAASSTAASAYLSLDGISWTLE